MINKNIKGFVKEYKKYSIDFESKNRDLLDDFERFMIEFDATLIEKVKSLERLIIKSYVTIAIKAVANEFLTISFLNNELKIKKQSLQDHLIFLI